MMSIFLLEISFIYTTAIIYITFGISLISTVLFCNNSFICDEIVLNVWGLFVISIFMNVTSVDDKFSLVHSSLNGERDDCNISNRSIVISWGRFIFLGSVLVGWGGREHDERKDDDGDGST